MTIHTFLVFWNDWHRINPGRKLDRQRCETIWNDCHFSDIKERAIKEITKTNESAFEYLKSKLLKP